MIIKTRVDGMDLMPSNIDLSGAEVQLVHEVGREFALGRVLQPVIPDYDVILIDCQPSLGLLTVNALACADGVLVPLECEYFALRGVALLMETIDKVSSRLSPKLAIDGLLATMYDSRTLHTREVLAGVVQGFGDLVFHTVISRTVRFPDSTVAGEPITRFDPACNGAHPTVSWPRRYWIGGVSVRAFSQFAPGKPAYRRRAALTPAAALRISHFPSPLPSSLKAIPQNWSLDTERAMCARGGGWSRGATAASARSSFKGESVRPGRFA